MLKLTHSNAMAWTIILGCGMTWLACAEPPVTVGTPPPELQKLASSIGVWEITTKYRFTSDAKVFEANSVETVRWSPNKQFLIADQQGMMPEGWKDQIVITSWNS